MAKSVVFKGGLSCFWSV